MTPVATPARTPRPGEIVIDLDLPQDGINASSNMNFYEAELGIAIAWVRDSATEAKLFYTVLPSKTVARTGMSSRVEIPHSRRAILVEGERGIGKTSFLLTLRARLNEPAGTPTLGSTRVYALPLLDPTLIDGDRVFVASVVSNILRELEDGGHLNGGCHTNIQGREKLQTALATLHHGLLASSEQTWNALMGHGASLPAFTDSLMKMAKGGLLFSDHLENFARAAAELLGVDMLVQPLDDVDNAGSDAWNTMEVIRKHLTGPSLLPVVAGSFEQMVTTTWEERLKTETKGSESLKVLDEGMFKARLAQVRNDALQHLDKLFHPARRLQLRTKREEILRKGRVFDGSARANWLLNGTLLDRRVGDFLDDCEAVLYAVDRLTVTGRMIDLIPNNTRRMVELLRTWELLLTTNPKAEPQGSPMRSGVLLRTCVLHESSLQAVGSNFQVIESVASQGVSTRSIDLLVAVWPVLSRGIGAGRMGAREPQVAARLVEAAMRTSFWDSATVLDYLVGPATVIAHYHQFVGLQTNPATPPKKEELGVKDLLSLVLQGASARRVLADRTSQTKGSYRRPIGHWWQVKDPKPPPDLQAAYDFYRILFTTKVKAANGHSQLIDPLRPLEHLARFFRRANGSGGARVPTIPSWASGWWNRLPMERGGYVGFGSASDAAAEDEGGEDVGPVASDLAVEPMLRSLMGWAHHLEAVNWSPSPLTVPSIARRYAEWQDAFRKREPRLSKIAEGSTVTAARYLQQSVLGLIHATLCEEIIAMEGACRHKTGSPEALQWWNHARTVNLSNNLLSASDRPTKITSKDPPKIGLEAVFSLVKLGSEVPGWAEGTATPAIASWVRRHAPLSYFWISCPVFRSILNNDPTDGWSKWFDTDWGISSNVIDDCAGWGKSMKYWKLLEGGTGAKEEESWEDKHRLNLVGKINQLGVEMESIGYTLRAPSTTPSQAFKLNATLNKKRVQQDRLREELLRFDAEQRLSRTASDSSDDNQEGSGVSARTRTDGQPADKPQDS